ncbi:Glycogen debranching enzyme [Dirofilaria immitis]|nr:Glycogen debranching enzyme [Dirofilaria immitis]
MFKERGEKNIRKVTESIDKIIGLNGAKVEIREHLRDVNSKLAVIKQYEINGKLHLKYFPSGSVIVIKVSPIKKAIDAIKLIDDYLSGKNDFIKTSFIKALEQLTLQNYNMLLFRCNAEDHDDFGSGSYNIPNWKALNYCGLQGLLPYLNDIRFYNDLGHPICQNLRDGLWLCDYIYHRLNKCNPLLAEIARIIQTLFLPLHDVPPFITASIYVQTLALSSVSFLGAVKNAKLSVLPNGYKTADELPSSLSAGLPHFATGIWRNWGRDTFIALPGCCLVTGRFEDARSIKGLNEMGYCIRDQLRVVKFNLIIWWCNATWYDTESLDEGHGSRYNARDAVWFWLYAIIKYIEIVPNGNEILKNKLLRIFINDDTIYGNDLTEQYLADTMQETLMRHFNGIEFIERNAGKQIDDCMQEEGFHIKAYVDHNTGFIYGGNLYNCGTWMDKMGSSEKAGNKGWPATPRDGAAVELQGLCYAVIEKLDKLYEQKFYPYKGVVSTTGSKINEPRKSLACIGNCRKVLLGPLGIKTLDPSDYNYCPFYNQDDDSTDKKIARGMVMGGNVFYRAKLAIAKVISNDRNDKKFYENAKRFVRSRMGIYWEYLKCSTWTSLPELTNDNGTSCYHSCGAQAWSIGCLLETVDELYELHKFVKI